MIHKICEKFGMETNGYAYFHKQNFLVNDSLPCYVPENAECAEDIFSRDDLERLVKEWTTTDAAKAYLLEAYDGVMPEIDEKFISDFTMSLYESLEWQFPSTILDNY